MEKHCIKIWKGLKPVYALNIPKLDGHKRSVIHTTGDLNYLAVLHIIISGCTMKLEYNTTAYNLACI